MPSLLDFLSPEAGQRRRKALDSGIESTLRHILGPQLFPKAESAARLADYFNPVTGVGEMMQGGRQAVEGEGWDRVQGIGRMTSGMAATLAPMAGKADDAAKIIDALVGWSPARQGAVDEAARFVGDESGAIKAFHGSPHDFDKFSMEKIGTGEGAQAYGHGLYFAEEEQVARNYWKSLTNRQRTWRLPRPDEGAKMIPQGPEGRMYEVNINADPGDFLDWDKPLSEQPSVTSRLRALGRRHEDELMAARAERDALAAQRPGPPANASLEEHIDWAFTSDPWSREPELMRLNSRVDELEAAAQDARKRGALFSDDLNDDFLLSTQGRNLARVGGQGFNRDATDLLGAGNDAELAGLLRDADIPGIKYLDQGSRAAGDGSRNYVVFDDKLIEIVKKYGIAAAAPMLGMSVPEAQRAWDQQEAAKTIREYLEFGT